MRRKGYQAKGRASESNIFRFEGKRPSLRRTVLGIARQNLNCTMAKGERAEIVTEPTFPGIHFSTSPISWSLSNMASPEAIAMTWIQSRNIATTAVSLRVAGSRMNNKKQQKPAIENIRGAAARMKGPFLLCSPHLTFQSASPSSIMHKMPSGFM